MPDANAAAGGCTAPLLARNCALYLDFDGTLTDIAPHPDLVEVRDELPGQLRALQRHLHGAVAIITGRQLGVVDELIAPLQIPAAGLHGAELRHGDGVIRGVRPAPGLPALLRDLHAHFAGQPGIFIEDKATGVALHYRQAPALADECQRTLQRLLPEGLDMITGHMLVEARPVGVNKGQALKTLSERPPFAGRTPVFVGDDVTDEDAFHAAKALGGHGIKVGQGETTARYRCRDVQAVHDWLQLSLAQLDQGEIDQGENCG
jgi:trehalose 6-phosphate phosphatase